MPTPLVYRTRAVRAINAAYAARSPRLAMLMRGLAASYERLADQAECHQADRREAEEPPWRLDRLRAGRS